MEKELENIIQEKNYSALSQEDKTALADWVSSEEEFDVLKQILTTASTLNEGVAPSPKLRASLMETFAAQHGAVNGPAAVSGGVRNSKIILMRSVAAIAALFLLFMLLFPFGNKESKTNLTAEKKTTETKSKETPNNVEKDADSVQKIIAPQSEIEADQVPEPIIQIASSERPAGIAARTPAPQLMEDGIVTADAFASAHSDRLETHDLPEKSRQVVQDNPAILDVLYTSF